MDMETDKNGVVTFEEYEAFKNDQKEKEKLRKEALNLREEIAAKEECLKEIEDRLHSDMNMYKFSEPALQKHKYWASDDFLYIAEVKEISSPKYVRYLVSTPDEVNSLHSSSTLGLLWNYPIPISKKRYDELMLLMLPQEEYDKLMNKK